LRAIVDALRGKLADLMVENATLTARLAEETYKVTK
jgi:hypothetical protein